MTKTKTKNNWKTKTKTINQNADYEWCKTLPDLKLIPHTHQSRRSVTLPLGRTSWSHWCKRLC